MSSSLRVQGSVSSYDKENKYYRVVYEDDDTEEYTVTELVKLIDGSKLEEADMLQGQSRGKSITTRRSTGGRKSSAGNSSKRATLRKSSLTKEPGQRTATKARHSRPFFEGFILLQNNVTVLC